MSEITVEKVIQELWKDNPDPKMIGKAITYLEDYNSFWTKLQYYKGLSKWMMDISPRPYSYEEARKQFEQVTGTKPLE